MYEITILHVADCAGGRAALEIASRIAQNRPDVRVREVTLDGESDGLAAGFRGSPTVLVDGRDIEAEPQAPIGSMG